MVGPDAVPGQPLLRPIEPAANGKPDAEQRVCTPVADRVQLAPRLERRTGVEIATLIDDPDVAAVQCDAARDGK
jgi:hypothetical protein